jgi:hypothetical protein
MYYDGNDEIKIFSAGLLIDAFKVVCKKDDELTYEAFLQQVTSPPFYSLSHFFSMPFVRTIHACLFSENLSDLIFII